MQHDCCKRPHVCCTASVVSLPLFQLLRRQACQARCCAQFGEHYCIVGVQHNRIDRDVEMRKVQAVAASNAATQPDSQLFLRACTKDLKTCSSLRSTQLPTCTDTGEQLSQHLASWHTLSKTASSLAQRTSGKLTYKTCLTLRCCSSHCVIMPTAHTGMQTKH